MPAPSVAIPDDVKTNAVADATGAAGSLLTSLFDTDEHGQVAAIVNFTPYSWKLVDGFGLPVGSTNSNAKWEKAATGLQPYVPALVDANSGHLPAASSTTFGLGGRLGVGHTQYSGAVCLYSGEARLNLFVAIGYDTFSLLGISGSSYIAMAFFIDGSEAHGDLAGFNANVHEALMDRNSGAYTDLKLLGDGLGFSIGAPATARMSGLKIQFTGAKETVFVLEPDDG